MTAAPSRPNRRSWTAKAVLTVNVFAVVVSLLAAALLGYGYKRTSSLNRIVLDRALTPVSSDGSGLRSINILLVGSDSAAGLDPDDPIQTDRRGEQLGDVIIIAHLEEGTGEMSLLSIPRDLWVRIAGTESERKINSAFEIGGPGLLIQTIEENFEIPINHYVNVDFAGFQGLVSVIGSVDVYFPTPARDWDKTADPPRSRTGFAVLTAGCHALDPEQSLAYVRSRYYQTQDPDGNWVTDPTSDLGRIRRQQDFLRRLMQEGIDKGARNPFVLNDLINAGLDNVVVDQDLNAQLLVDLGMAYRDFDPEQLQTYGLPAADGTVGTEQVLLPRLDDAEPVLAIFRGVPTTDPETVRVLVAAVDPTEPSVVSLNETLAEAGFTPVPQDRKSVPDTMVVAHGPDGAQAAEVVVDALARAGIGPVGVRQVDYLVGRTVAVSVPEPGSASEGTATTPDINVSEGSNTPSESNSSSAGSSLESPQTETSATAESVEGCN